MPMSSGMAWRWAVKSLVVSGYALLAITACSIVVRTGAELAGRAPAPHLAHGARDGP